VAEQASCERGGRVRGRRVKTRRVWGGRNENRRVGSRGVRSGSRDRGVTLVLVIVLLALVSLLGLAFALVSEEENLIGLNHLRGNQVLYLAEGVTRCVCGWFEQPDGALNPFVPSPAQVDRARRRVDPDGNGVHSPYASAPAPWNVIYRQGTDDLFERPYRGSPALSLEGDEAGPDIRISRSGGVTQAAFLDSLADALFPGFPSAHEKGRIARIDIFAPPVHIISGVPVRLGIATVAVTVVLLANYGTPEEREVAARTVKAVLADPPYRKACGPLLAAGDVDLRSGLEARWGIAAAGRDLFLPPASSAAAPSGWPRRGLRRFLLPDENGDGTLDDTDADGTGDWPEWWNQPDDTIEDPWFFASAGGSLPGASPAPVPDHLPWPFDPSNVPSGPIGPYDPDEDRSNAIQASTFGLVPDLGYEFWKMAARQTDSGHHYYAFDPVAGLWREDAAGPLVTVEEATAGRSGLFFFDTADGNPPADTDGDGTADNLAPAVILGDGWWCSGVLFVGASSLQFEGIGWQGRTRPVSPPGEPCADLDADGACGPPEPFLQLDYPADPLAPGAAFRRMGLASAASGAVRVTSGPASPAALAFEGLLIIAGDLLPGGDANILGSAIVGGSVRGAVGASPPTGVARLLADPSLPAGLGPSEESGAPRTAVVSWQVERGAVHSP